MDVRSWAAMNFADRLTEQSRRKRSVAVLGVDPQLDSPNNPGIPPRFTLTRFCCEIVEAFAPFVAAIKPQVAVFGAPRNRGMRAMVEVLCAARRLGLVTIA